LHPRFSEPLWVRDLAQLAQCSLNADQLTRVFIASCLLKTKFLAIIVEHNGASVYLHHALQQL